MHNLTPPPIKAWVANDAPPPPNGRVGVTAVCLSCWHPLYSPLCTYSSHVYFTTGPGIFHWLMNGQVACSKVHDIYGCILIDLPVQKYIMLNRPWTVWGISYTTSQPGWLEYSLAQASNLDLPGPHPVQLMNGRLVTRSHLPICSLYCRLRRASLSHRYCI